MSSRSVTPPVLLGEVRPLLLEHDVLAIPLLALLDVL